MGRHSGRVNKLPTWLCHLSAVAEKTGTPPPIDLTNIRTASTMELGEGRLVSCLDGVVQLSGLLVLAALANDRRESKNGTP